MNLLAVFGLQCVGLSNSLYTRSRSVVLLAFRKHSYGGATWRMHSAGNEDHEAASSCVENCTIKNHTECFSSEAGRDPLVMPLVCGVMI